MEKLKSHRADRADRQNVIVVGYVLFRENYAHARRMLKPQNASRESNTRGATVLGMHTWGPRGEVKPLGVSLACPDQIVIAWEFFQD
jgi:hypothetical protein